MFKSFLIFLAILMAVAETTSFRISPREKEIRRLKSIEIKQIMNQTADPCENYYEFACGNWGNLYPVSKATNGFTGAFSNAMREFAKRILYNLQNYNPTDTASEMKAKSFYKSCVVASKMNSKEHRSVLKSAIAEFGKMPALYGKKWKKENFNWLKTVGKIANKYGIGILLQFHIDMTPDMSSNFLMLQPQELLLHDSSDQAIKDYTSKIEFILFGFMGLKNSQAKRVASDIAKFEAKLAKASEERDDDTDPMYFENIEKCTGSPIDVQKLANLTFGYVPEGELYVKDFEYLESLANLIKKTPRETVANFIFFHLLIKFYADLKSAAGEVVCAERTVKVFPKIISQMSHRVYQLNETATEYRKMWQEIVISMENALEADILSWYEDSDREMAIEKLHMMTLFVDTFENVNLDEEYEDLLLSPNDFMANIKSIKSFRAKQKRELLDMAADYFPEIVNFYSPFYMIPLNSVFLPASTLLTDYLRISEMPKALKYARPGYLFGHEITHGFGGSTRFYDRYGTEVEIEDSTDDEFEERKTCIYEQYSNYKRVKTLRPQDEDQDENIADIAGVGLAYQAYIRWLNDPARTEMELKMESLPGLNYTNHQLFFIYFSQTWCASFTEEFDRRSSYDTHTIDPMRAVLPLMNFDKFAKAFNCPVGSHMNPEKRCSLV